MNLKSKIFITTSAIVIICISITVSRYFIEQINNNYEPKTQVNDKKTSSEENSHVNDIDNMMSIGIGDAKSTILPVKYENDFIVYENELYVTNNKGETWIKVLNNNQVGCAKISDYLNDVSKSSIYVSKDKTAIVYGGKGSDNISIISENSNTNYWSVGTISKTATHDLDKGYDKLYIDYIEGGENGYIVAIKNDGTPNEEKLVFTSVNTGVTWDVAMKTDEIYKIVLKHFNL